jgi:hypothetical protein
LFSRLGAGGHGDLDLVRDTRHPAQAGDVVKATPPSGGV